MNEAIKNRIEQIRYGEVPDGYKVTQSGILPMSWHAEQLSQHLQEYTEFSNDVVSLPVATSSREGLLLQSEYYQQQRFDETRIGYHVVPQDYITYRHMSDDDIFHFNINTFGQKVLVSPEYPVFTVKPTLILTLLVDYLNSSDRFLYYCRAQKKGSTRTRLYYKNLLKFQMPIPPLPEQQRIAEVLTCCDQVISLKKQLLEEKRRQKKWLMQKLLDPDSGVRVCDYGDSNWIEKTVAELGRITTGTTPPTDQEALWDGEHVWVTPTDMIAKYATSSERKISDLGLAKCRLIEAGSILVTCIASIGKIALLAVSGCCNQQINALTVFSKFDNEFIYYVMQNSGRLFKKLTGNTTTPIINSSDFSKMKLCIPEDKNEQTAIAVILSTADREIDLLDQELSQWQQKKKALMQLLLTGIVRVNV